MKSLNEWECFLEALSPPSHIELGLERVSAVWARLIQDAPPKVLTVAGTNGKGSFVEVAGTLSHHLGLRYGQYTSPHLQSINERIKLGGRRVTDQELISAFEVVESARSKVFLTYFEYLTLAAFVVFQTSSLDLWILEIGLGGRLDAVNIIDPDVSVITTIGLDHQQFLGDTLECIAREKAGVMRCGRTTWSNASNVASILAQSAKELSANIRFMDEVADRDKVMLPESNVLISLDNIKLPRPSAALACLAMDSLGYPLDKSIENPIQESDILGRMSSYVINGRTWILDVGHNQLACQFVTKQLSGRVPKPDRVVIFGALVDKDALSILKILRRYTTKIALVGIEGERGRSISSLESQWNTLFGQTAWRTFATLSDALKGLPAELGPKNQVLLFGSFILVADALRHDLFN